MRILSIAAGFAVIWAGSACQKTGDGNYEVKKPVIGAETDTIHTPSVETGTSKDTIEVPKVDVKTEKREVTVPKVEVKKAQ